MAGKGPVLYAAHRIGMNENNEGHAAGGLSPADRRPVPRPLSQSIRVCF